MVTIAREARRAPNLYRHLRTDALLTERELVGWDLAELDVDPDAWSYPDESVAYLRFVAEEMDHEINRRRRVRKSALAPAWRTPDVSDRKAEWDEIKRRVDLIDFVERYTPVKLRKAGREYVGCCPFPDHDDSSPSFSINPETQVFYCFGCQRGGDVFVFARLFLGLDSFTAAADVVGTFVGVIPGALYVKDKSGEMVRVK